MGAFAAQGVGHRRWAVPPRFWVPLACMALAIPAATVSHGKASQTLLVIANLSLVFALIQKYLLRWEVMIATILCVILLVPTGRYELPGNLPFNMELYRL